MEFDGVCGNAELGGDLFVAEPARHKSQHIELAGAEGAVGRRHRTRANHALAQYEIGVLCGADHRDLAIGLEQRRHPAARHGVGDVEVDPQLHPRLESRRSTSGAGTASARPETIIAAIPITLPSTSAIGPPEFPGASRTSAWTQGIAGFR